MSKLLVATRRIDLAVPVSLFIVSWVIGISSTTSAQDGDRPNIVFILADDLGYGDIKCFGEDRSQIDTPYFDRLAREGMRFTNAHANASICVPTRVGVMTGRYPWRFAPPEAGGPWGFLGLQIPVEHTTVAKMLGDHGYRTGYVGKWHLGTRMQTTDGKVQGVDNVDYSKPLSVGPGHYGFEASFILPGSLDMFPYAFVRNNEWVGNVTAHKGWSAFNRVGPAAEDFIDEKVLGTFGDEAERFLDSCAEDAKSGKPFFLYLALTSPHTPVSPSDAFKGTSRLGIYGDFVMETDHCVGRVLEALDRLGLSDNTLVIATSDHGPALYAGRIAEATPNQLRELEKDGHFSSGIYRGYKFSAYEGAFRVPFVARWPDRIRAHSTSDRLIGLPDLYATLAELAGHSLADDEAPDSFSLVRLFDDGGAAGVRPSMIVQAANAFAVIADEWKLLLCPGSGCNGRYGNTPPSQQAWRDAREEFGQPPENWSALIQAPFVQLFHLSDDPTESVNLAGDDPERVAELAAIGQAIIDNGRSRPGDKLNNDRSNLRLFRSVPSFVWQ